MASLDCQRHFQGVEYCTTDGGQTHIVIMDLAEANVRFDVATATSTLSSASNKLQATCPPKDCTPGREVRRDFFIEVLERLADVPLSDFAVDALVLWEPHEDTSACWNPLATTWGMEGSCDFNSVGVRHYLSQDMGTQATAKTLAQQGYYDNIRRMLRLEEFNREGLRADLSLWGTCSGEVCSLLDIWQDHWNNNSGGPLPSDDARLAEPVWPVIALSGEGFQVTIALRNEGTTTWQNEAGHALVNAKNPMGAPTRLPLPHDVPPAETATWTLNLTAPKTPGLHQSRWQLEHGDEPVGDRITVWVGVLLEEAREWKVELDRLIEEAKRTWEEAKQRGEEDFERFLQELVAQLQRELARIIEEQSQALLEAFLRGLEETCCTGALMPAGALVLVGMWLGRRRKS